MSKSRGNTVDPFEMFDQYGADALKMVLITRITSLDTDKV